MVEKKMSEKFLKAPSLVHPLHQRVKNVYIQVYFIVLHKSNLYPRIEILLKALQSNLIEESQSKLME